MKKILYGLCLMAALGISACADDGGDNHGAPEQPGGNPGTTPGGNPGTNPGGNPGTNPGGNPGTNPGGNPGTTPGEQCKEGTYECNMNVLLKCSSGNLVVDKSCTTAQKCDTVIKDCVDATTPDPGVTPVEPGTEAKCMEGERQCHADQSSVDKCVSGDWAVETKCEDGTTCDPNNGIRCDIVSTVEKECEEGTLKCDENGSRILGCASGRLMVAEVCDTSKLIFCDPDSVTCKEACEEGSFLCKDDDTVLECKNNKWIEKSKCTEGQVCNAADGVCKAVSKCTEGHAICIGEQTAICKNGEYVDDKFCPDGTTCFNGKCEDIPKTCTDGVRCLNSYILVSCQNNVETETRCGDKGGMCYEKNGGAVCEDAVCFQNECKDSSTLNICDTVANTVTPQRCGSGKRCDSKTNSCVTVVCQEGQKRCNNNSVEVCTDNAWVVKNDCGTQMCDATKKACVDVKCKDGDTRCNAKGNIETCKNNQFSGAKSCDKATPVCETVSETSAKCVERVCTEGSKQCSGADLQKCVNNRWVTAQTCDSAALCSAKDGICRSHECENGAQACSNSLASTKVCKDYVWELTLCSSINKDSRCFASNGKASCEVPVCTNGFSCDGNTLKKCDNNAYIMNVDCGSDKLCNSTKGICESKICSEGSYACKGNLLQKCESNAWKTASTCTSNETCNATAKQCVVNECRVGQTKCDGSNVYKCDNGSWALADKCSATQTCDSSSGECVNKDVCSSGYKCDNNALYTCKSGQWELTEQCASGKTCNTSVGVCAECYGNTIECRGQDVYQCNSSLKMVKTQTCSSTEYCMADGHGGGCVPKQVSECTSGTYRCDGLTLQVCSTSGKWTISRTCDSATQTCDASLKDCKNKGECTYGYKCNGSSLMECKNGAWTEKAVCGNGEQCDFNAGICRQCDTRFNKYTCKGQDLYYCSGNQWVKEKTCGSNEVCDASPYSGSCTAKAETCTNNTKRCEDNKLQKCVSGAWTDEMACDSVNGLCVAEGTTGSCVQSLALPEWCNIQAVNEKFDRGYGRILIPENVSESQISAEFVCGNIGNPVAGWYSAAAVQNMGCGGECGNNVEYMSVGISAPAGTYQCAYRFNFGGRSMICTKDGGAPIIQTTTTKLTEAQTLKLVVNDPSKVEKPSWCWFKHLEMSSGNHGEGYLHVYPGALSGGQIKAELLCGSKSTPVTRWSVISQATENVFCDSCGSNNIEYMTKPSANVISSTQKCAFRIQFNNNYQICPIEESKGNNMLTISESSQTIPDGYYRPE